MKTVFRYPLLTVHTKLKLVIFIFLLFFSHSPFAQQTIILNTAFGSPVSNPSQTGFADQVASEAFQRLGYRLETVQMPAERALINANRGIDDGDLVRVAGLQKKYPNLIQVPESILVIDMVLFTKNRPTFVVQSWESVSSYSLAIISGWKIMEKNFGKLGEAVEIIKTDNAEQSFTLLKNNRVDFVAYSNWSGLGYLKTNKINDVTLLEPPLAQPKFYIYLHKKHKKLISRLTETIREMKKDGSIDALHEQILKPYLFNSHK